MGKENKVMEAKNRKVRHYDMLASKWAQQTASMVEIRHGEYDCHLPKRDGADMAPGYERWVWTNTTNPNAKEPGRHYYVVIKTGNHTTFKPSMWDAKQYVAKHPKAKIVAVKQCLTYEEAIKKYGR